MTHLRIPPKFNPTLESEVHAFGTVHSKVEPGVVASGVGNDELSSVLD